MSWQASPSFVHEYSSIVRSNTTEFAFITYVYRELSELSFSIVNANQIAKPSHFYSRLFVFSSHARKEIFYYTYVE